METIKKSLTLAMMVLWGIASLLIFCAEDTPGQTTPLLTLILTKAAALVSLFACYRVLRKAEREGKFPDFWYANDDNTL